MITEKDLQEAIAECEGQRNPNANTCIKLAAFYVIKNQLYPSAKTPAAVNYSFSSSPTQHLDRKINDYIINSNSEFARAVEEAGEYHAWKVMDDLMSTLSVINPQLYNSILRKMAE